MKTLNDVINELKSTVQQKTEVTYRIELKIGIHHVLYYENQYGNFHVQFTVNDLYKSSNHSQMISTYSKYNIYIIVKPNIVDIEMRDFTKATNNQPFSILRNNIESELFQYSSLYDLKGLTAENIKDVIHISEIFLGTI